MSKHTPGPWRKDQTTTGRYSGVNIETSTGVRVASAGFSPFTIHEKQANARLIAAAPDLLKASKQALEKLDPESMEAQDLARAIALAEWNVG